jgi:hypothetical protein
MTKAEECRDFRGFGHQDGIDLKEYFHSMIENIHTLINANDKNYNQRFENVTQATQAALASSDRAVAKAESASEKRFDAVNEFRATLADQQRTLMPRSEYEVQHKALIDKIDVMQKTINERLEKIENFNLLDKGKGEGQSNSWAFIVGGIAVVASVIALLLNAIRLFGGVK